MLNSGQLKIQGSDIIASVCITPAGCKLYTLQLHERVNAEPESTCCIQSAPLRSRPLLTANYTKLLDYTSYTSNTSCLITLCDYTK